jgi:hypothetical protein
MRVMGDGAGKAPESQEAGQNLKARYPSSLLMFDVRPLMKT